MASTSTPMTWTPYCSKTPERAKAEERFNPVCPPKLGSRASGCSCRMISAMYSGVSGSRQVTSAIPGSVIMVAGLEFTRQISYSSFLRALQAWVPE